MGRFPDRHRAYARARHCGGVRVVPAKHRKPDAPGDYVTRRGEPRSSAPARHGTGKARTSSAAAKAAEPVTSPSGGGGYVTTPRGKIPWWAISDHPRGRASVPGTPKAPDRTAARAARSETRTARAEHRAAVGERVAYNRAIQSATAGGGSPSTVGGALTGAAAGTATGAAIGSAVPIIGTATGATSGAVLGGVAGARRSSQAKKLYRQALRGGPDPSRRYLVAEFVIAFVIIAIAPLSDKNKNMSPGAWMRRMTATMLLFFVLALLSATGRTASKAAAGFGGLAVLALVVSEQDLFTVVAKSLSSSSDKQGGGSGPPIDAEALGEDIGNLAQDIASEVNPGG